MTNVIISVNNDTQDLPKGSSGVVWTDIVPGSDNLIMTRGDNVVKNGETIPSASQLTQAGIILDGTEQNISKYLLSDISDNQLKEIYGMGNQDKRYVMAFDFDGVTASEPVLEAWDDNSMNTIDNTILGAGVATSSWLRGITTTSTTPGNDWVGSRLAGAGDGNFLWLNNGNGPLSVAGILYCNLKMVVPAIQVAGVANTPIIVVKFATN